MNQFVLVGRVTDPLKVSSNSKNVLLPLKCVTGDEHYILYIKITGSILKNAMEYLKENDLVGIKGHFESKGLDHRSLVCDKITFLSSHKEDK